MSQKTYTQKTKVFILLLSQFDEEWVFSQLIKLRKQGVMVQLVGLAKTAVKSQFGTKLLPDLSLENVPPPSPDSMVITNGNVQLNAFLIAEPRLKHWLHGIRKAGGTIS